MMRARNGTMEISDSDRAHGEPGVPSRRAVPVLACVCGGLLLARALPIVPSPAWFAVACACAAIAGLARGTVCKAALAAGAISFGGGWWTCRVAERPTGPLWDLLDTPTESGEPAERLLLLEGIVLDEPRADPPSGAMAAFAQREPFGSFRLSATGLKSDRGWIAASGEMWSRARGTTWDATRGLGGFGLHAGDRVRVSAIARATRPPSNPGEPDRRLVALQSGSVGSIRIDSPALIEPAPGSGTTSDAARSWSVGAAARVRAASARLLDPGPVASNDPAASAQSDRARAILASLFLGVREAGEPEIRAQFTRLGISHVLAISGFHVTVAVGVALLLVRLTGDRGRLEPLLVAALVGAYLVLVPAEAPVVRAAIMVLALLVSRGLGRRYDDLNTLAWAGVALLLWRPMDLWSLGFQLSLGLTALLLWQGRAFHERLFGAPILGLARAGAATSLLVSLATMIRRAAARTLSAGLLCWLASAPLIAVTTGTLSPLAVLAGFCVLPMVAALMWLGYGVLVVGLFAGAMGIDLAPWTSAVLGPPASWVVRVAGWLDRVPGTSVQVPPLSVWWGLAGTACAMIWILRWSARDRIAWLATCVVAGWGVGEFAMPRVGAARQRAVISELSLDGGSCTVIQSTGETVLWNCGGSPSSAGRGVARAARELGVWRATTVVLAGDDLSSMAALPDLADSLGVREVWLSPSLVRLAETEPDGPAAWLLNWMDEKEISAHEIRDGDTLRVGAAALELRTCGPDVATTGVRAGAAAPAVIGLLTIESLTGGPPRETSRVVLASEPRDRDAQSVALLRAELRATIIQLPRHGGSRTVAGTLVSRSDAAAAISLSRDTEHEARGADLPAIVLSTRTCGAICAAVDSDGYARLTATRVGTRSAR